MPTYVLTNTETNETYTELCSWDNLQTILKDNPQYLQKKNPMYNVKHFIPLIKIKFLDRLSKSTTSKYAFVGNNGHSK